jgi:hypothetical protein
MGARSSMASQLGAPRVGQTHRALPLLPLLPLLSLSSLLRMTRMIFSTS